MIRVDVADYDVAMDMEVDMTICAVCIGGRVRNRPDCVVCLERTKKALEQDREVMSKKGDEESEN